MQLINVNEIRDAVKRLKGVIVQNPLSFAPNLSKLANTNVYLKKENLQLTGAFKIRGAFNKLAKLKESDDKNATQILNRGVICASAGNHAQGVAYAARHFGVKAVIVMPEATPLLKVQGTMALGAQVLLAGNNYDEACERALQIAKEQNLTFIHPFADSDVIAGQGSIALEMIDEQPLDVVVVPVGGGGLISGIASAYKALSPHTKIIGVNAKGANAMRLSFESKIARNAKSVRTIADGIAVRDVNSEIFECILAGVDSIVEVDDDEIASAILFLLENQKLVVEGAGAAAVAAIIHKKFAMESSARIGAILSGGNIDVTMLNTIIQKGLLKSDRKMKFQVVLVDKPGSLQRLTELLSAQGANIVFINYSRVGTNIEYGDAIVQLALEIKGREHKESIQKILHKNGYVFEMVM